MGDNSRRSFCRFLLRINLFDVGPCNAFDLVSHGKLGLEPQAGTSVLERYSQVMQEASTSAVLIRIADLLF